MKKRRRFADPNSWKRNVAKRSRVAGESYISQKGVQRPKKVMKTTNCECRFKCREKISTEQQQSIFKEYYSLGDSIRQKHFICSLIEEAPVVRRRKRMHDSGIEKKTSRFYFLPCGDEKIRVCAKFFCNTFAFSKKTIEITLQHKSPNSGSYIGVDGRKGKPAHNATPKEIVNSIKSFLNRLPKVPSHYCRQRSQRLYLPPDLTITKIFELYCEENPDKLVREHVFRRIFKEYEPPLVIFQPKKDQCMVCNLAERTGTTETDEKYKDHRERNTAIQAMKKSDKEHAKLNEKTTMYLTFDLQAVLTLPYAGDGQIYYSRKLSVLNFTIHDSKERGICFLWDETCGNKGSAEIATFLIRYLENLPSEITSVVMYADTCGGQNRNKNVLAALLYVVNKNKTGLQTIDLKFLESGHSYLEADSIHATIEREKKHKNIYVPDEYKLVIEMSRRKPFPYEVNSVKYNDIYDLEDLNNQIIKNVKKTVSGSTVNWLLCKWFRFQRGSSQVGLKYDVTCSSFEYFDVNIHGIDWNSVVLKKKYAAPLMITMEKKRDLLNLLKKGVIPETYATYYNNLPCGTRKKKIKDFPLWDVKFNPDENELAEEVIDDPHPHIN